MMLCKPFYKKHRWLRYDNLVEQLFVGGYCAWQRCERCWKIKFDKADLNTPQEPGWKENKANIDRIMGYKVKEYK